jgi:uncharacterized membrane protein
MAKLLPTTVVIAVFNNEGQADMIASSLMKAIISKQIHGITHEHMAMTIKNENGKVKVCEMGNGLRFAYGSIGGFVGGLYAPCLE